MQSERRAWGMCVCAGGHVSSGVALGGQEVFAELVMGRRDMAAWLRLDYHLLLLAEGPACWKSW